LHVVNPCFRFVASGQVNSLSLQGKWRRKYNSLFDRFIFRFFLSSWTARGSAVTKREIAGIAIWPVSILWLVLTL